MSSGIGKINELTLNLIENYKKRDLRKIKDSISNLLQNKFKDYQQILQKVNIIDTMVMKVNYKQALGGGQNWNQQMMNDESVDQQNKGFYEFLQRLISYISEREKGGQNIVLEFKSFFMNKSVGNLLNDEFVQQIFCFVTKQILAEFQRIVKVYRAKTNSEQAIKFSTQVQRQLERESIDIMQNLLRSVNQKNAQKLKLLVSNQQMKVHFMLYQFDRAAKCDKPATEKILLEISPLSDLITYYYYKGRISIFNSDFQEASENLQKVLESCPQNKKGLKVGKQVLKYLIPVNLFLGKYPSKDMLSHYKLTEYTELCKAVKQGNIKALQKITDKYRPLWIKRSLIILLDQMKVLTYRNLCKKVWLINGKSNKPNLIDFQIAFKVSHPEDQPPAMQEVCCIISNLIFMKLIVGKIYQNNEKNIQALTLSERPFSGVKPQDVNWKS